LLAIEDAACAAATAVALRERGWDVTLARDVAALAELAGAGQDVAVIECTGERFLWGQLQALCARVQPRPCWLLVCSPAERYQVLQLPVRSHAYATRPPDPARLVEQAEALTKGLPGNLDACLCVGGVALDPIARLVYMPGAVVRLPKRQFDLLQLLMLRPGQVVTREEAVRHLFRWEQDLASNAIDVHVHYLRQRLPPTLIHTVRGLGYVLKERRPAEGTASST
jgi:DNA-binding response OmpR family regulator